MNGFNFGFQFDPYVGYAAIVDRMVPKSQSHLSSGGSWEAPKTRTRTRNGINLSQIGTFLSNFLTSLVKDDDKPKPSSNTIFTPKPHSVSVDPYIDQFNKNMAELRKLMGGPLLDDETRTELRFLLNRADKRLMDKFRHDEEMEQLSQGLMGLREIFSRRPPTYF